MNSFEKEPYYSIEFSAIACKFEILVNDIPVSSFEVDGQMSPTVPVNYAILKSGKQYLSVKLLPLNGKQFLGTDADFRYTVKLYDVARDEFNFLEDSISYSFDKQKNDGKQTVLAHSAQFNAEIPYQMTDWENSRELLSISKEKDYIPKKLDAAYSEILKLLRNKQYDLFYDKIKFRERNMAVSMYLSEDEVNARIHSLIEDLDEGFVVMDLPADRIMKMYGHGKLATYKKLNGEPAFQLLNEKTKEEIMLEFMFHIPQGKENFEVI